jgi:hypothetical protein
LQRSAANPSNAARRVGCGPPLANADRLPSDAEGRRNDDFDDPMIRIAELNDLEGFVESEQWRRPSRSFAFCNIFVGLAA